MRQPFSSFADKARRLESALAARVEGASRQATGASTRQPLEIVLAVVDAVEQEIQPIGRGRRAFPFTQVHVQFAAASAKVQAHLEEICEGPPTLQSRVIDRLTTTGCAVKTVEVGVTFATEALRDWTHPEFDVQCTGTPVNAAGSSQPVRLELTVTHGTAERTVYVFDSAPVALGRGDEVRDDRQRLLRTNHVAFTEGDGEVNRTVSRRHARIEQDVASGSYRLFDDGSAQGTSVIRHGRGFPVPRGAKGLRLQSGDEIVLGRARVKVRT